VGSLSRSTSGTEKGLSSVSKAGFVGVLCGGRFATVKNGKVL
jgi:hypothetical protein